VVSNPQPATPRIPQESKASPLGSCGNCGATLIGPFCSQCGEKRFSKHDYSLGHILEEVFEGLAHLDTRFLRTLRVLITRPGELSNAYFRGGRSRYTKPLSLFIILNVVFFFIQPHTPLFGYRYKQYTSIPRYAAVVDQRLRDTGEAGTIYEARFNENLQHEKKSVLIFAVPVLALAMSLLFIGSGRTYAEHLVFSVQVYAFFLVYLATAVLLVLYPLTYGLTWLFPEVHNLPLLGGEVATDTVLFMGLLVYGYLGLRRAYQTSKTRSALIAFGVAVTVPLTLIAYHTMLFYLSYWTT
jgi:Protein of unknown function (DUF3667)